MRNISIKDNGLSINLKSATIKLEWNMPLRGCVPETELKALAILLGAYNQYGRGIDLSTHRERIKRFNDLLQEITNDIQVDHITHTTSVIAEIK